MSISPRAIRNNITIKFDGRTVDTKTVLEASETWEPKHESLFVKLLKQGGKFTANGVVVEVFPAEQMLTCLRGGTHVHPLLQSCYCR